MDRLQEVRLYFLIESIYAMKTWVHCRQWLLEYFWIIKGFDFFACVYSQSSIKSFFPFLRHLPDFKQRIAGQCLPLEDFAIHKANKYFEQNGRLFLPGVVSDYIRLAFTEHSQDTLLNLRSGVPFFPPQKQGRLIAGYTLLYLVILSLSRTIPTVLKKKNKRNYTILEPPFTA